MSPVRSWPPRPIILLDCFKPLNMKSGSLGEIAVMKHFAALGYNVYSAVTENAPVDLIVELEGKFSTVEVKSTSYRYRDGYKVQLKKVRSNKSANKITNFNPNAVDFLAVYIVPDDVVKIFLPSEVTAKTEMVVRV